MSANEQQLRELLHDTAIALLNDAPSGDIPSMLAQTQFIIDQIDDAWKKLAEDEARKSQTSAA